jgi:hypothetical protein
MITSKERLQKLTRDYRIMWAISLVLMTIPLIYPLGLPTIVSQPVKDYYTAIVNLPEGSVVAVSFGASAQLLDEQEAQFLATWKTLFERRLKIIFYSTTEDGPIVLNKHLGRMVKPESYGYAYGVDYVNLGFSPLGEAGQTAFAQSIRSVYPNDINGTPLDQIPLMEDIDDQNDIDLLIYEYTSCTDIEWAVRQWVVPYNTKVLATTLGCCGPMAAPYYPTQVQGFLSGSGAGTELEVVSKHPGPGAAMSDSKSLGILPFLAFIIYGNLQLLRKEEK